MIVKNVDTPNRKLVWATGECVTAVWNCEVDYSECVPNFLVGVVAACQ